jgi:hypothetical protein
MFQLMLSLTLLLFLFSQCMKDDLTDELSTGMKSAINDGRNSPPEGMFKVTIENVSETYNFFKSGVFNTSDGASSPGPLLPGSSYSFTFPASKGHKLSFATMYVQSNDLFFGPSDAGLDLFNGDNPVTGDVTSMISLWDAGTEVNENPGTGPNQPIRQSSPNTGPAENGNVMMVNDAFTYPTVDQTIKVTLDYDGTSMFTVTIMNLSGSLTPLAPGVWVIHDMPYALYKDGMPDYGKGLEGLAEDGNAGPLGEYLAMNSGYVSPLAPGVWMVHNNNKSLFDDGKMDYGNGLEALAENGDPSELAGWLISKEYNIGVFNTPDGTSAPGALMPGQSYSFTFEAKGGEYLSFATMLVHTNDLFFAPLKRGFKLFNGNQVMVGDITSEIKLWDAGTEVNEYPGAGIHQPARLNGGIDENGNVKMVNDGFMYPDVDQIIKVTIEKM